MRTIDEALQSFAQQMDQAYTERSEDNFARMVEHNLTADEIEDFQKIEADTYRATRADALAKLREWLQRDGLTPQ